jgi:hypothetical protein
VILRTALCSDIGPPNYRHLQFHHTFAIGDDGKRTLSRSPANRPGHRGVRPTKQNPQPHGPGVLCEKGSLLSGPSCYARTLPVTRSTSFRRAALPRSPRR